MEQQLPIIFFLEQPGTIAIGTNDRERSLTIRTTKNGQQTIVQLNKHEARALCQALINELAHMNRKGSTDGNHKSA